MSNLTVNDSAGQQWGSIELGDKRCTQRAIHLGAQMAALLAAGLPGQTPSWSDLKAAYRLLHEDDVTHQALSLPHWRHTRQRAEQINDPVLFMQDGSELDFTLRQAQGGKPCGAAANIFIHALRVICSVKNVGNDKSFRSGVRL